MTNHSHSEPRAHDGGDGALLAARARTLDAAQFLGEYSASQWLSAEALHDLQVAALRRMVWHCLLNVPRMATAIGRSVPLSRLAHLDSPVELPVQRAAERRSAAETFAAVDARTVGPCRMTAGTRGAPQPVILDREARLRQIAVRLRAERWAGAPPARIVEVWGRDVLREPCALDADQLERLADDLAGEGPAVVSAPATSYTQLAHALRDRRADVRAVIARGEDPEAAAQRFAEQFGARIFPWYGAAELGVIASLCERARQLHVHADHLLVEVVDARDRPLPTGTIGRILVTDLYNQASPYLRYELEDVGRFVEGNCPCGRALPLFEVWGRTR